MAALKASSSLYTLQYSSTTSHRRGTAKATLNLPKRVTKISLPHIKSNTTFEQLEKQLSPNVEAFMEGDDQRDSLVVAKLYAIMEAVADRVEMHKNIGDQRDNWNTLLLTSINSLTLAAATMAGIASISHHGEAVTYSSTVMYVAATGLLSIVNKIQPSQLAEEQRNATRLFKQLHNQIQTILSIGNPTAVDVKEMMDKVLALDKAFPLPLLGAMLDKFPATVEPAVWWPKNSTRKQPFKKINQGYNGWNGKLEKEMKEIVKVIKRKDEEDYLRLGEKALKLNKFLAISAPILTAMAAVASAMPHSHGGDWAAALAVGGGALATAINSLEHGGQVGMVFEMYRSNAGFFKLMQESIESNLKEDDLERRENGEMVEMKVALQLGRTLSELRSLAEDSSVKGEAIDEFASKLF